MNQIRKEHSNSTLKMFISKNIKYYIKGKINPVDSTKSYTDKSNIRMTDNFVVHQFPQTAVRKNCTLIDEIEFAGIASTIKGCASYYGLRYNNAETVYTGFMVPIHEGQNFEAEGNKLIFDLDSSMI